MAYYRNVGNVPHKRHVQHRNPEGGLYYEELMGEEGFSSDSTLMYHTFIPAATVSYTHLDVYKRQGRYRPTGSRRRCGPGGGARHGGLVRRAIAQPECA